MRNTLLAVFAGAAALLLWRVVGERDDSPPANPELTAERAAPREDAARPQPPPEEPSRELPPPDPVLQQSAQRRFSSPAAHGASGGIAGAEPEGPATAPAAGPRFGGGVGLPGGASAPTSGDRAGAFAPSPTENLSARANKRTADERTRSPSGRAASKKTGPEDASSPEADSPVDQKSTAAAAKLVAATRGLKDRDDTAAMRAASSAGAGIMRQLALDQQVDAGIRKAIAKLSSSGQPFSMEDVQEAAEEEVRGAGLAPQDVDLMTAIVRASGPPQAEIPPAAYAAAVDMIVSAPPLDPVMLEEVNRMADLPPEKRAPPRAPAPRGALDAFRQHHGVFDKALKDFGVRPEHILGILGVETGWGRNTGKFPLPATLLAISRKTGRDGRPTSAAIQAGRDLAALARLSASGNLGGLTPDQVRGSYAGAMGIPQFLPTSWEAFSRSPDGGKRDPFNFGTAAYSVGNYLKVHGYSRDVPRSVWGYNHSQEYVDKVLGLSADVKASLGSAPSK